MVICPECKKEIQYLDFLSIIEQKGTFTENGDININQEEFKKNKFWCPVCDSFLFEDDEEAREFLTAEVEE